MEKNQLMARRLAEYKLRHLVFTYDLQSSNAKTERTLGYPDHLPAVDHRLRHE